MTYKNDHSAFILQGGLGNQIWIALAAKQFSRFHSLPVVFQTQYLATRSSHNQNVLDLLDEDEFIEQVNLPKPVRLAVSRIGPKFLGKSLSQIWSVRREPSVDEFYAPRRSTKEFLVGYFQDLAFTQKADEDELRDRILETIKGTDFERIARDLQKQDSVAVHIRRGDYSSNPKLGLLDSTFYESFIRLFDGKKAKFHVFSDDIEIVKWDFWPKSTVFLGPGEANAMQSLALMSMSKKLLIANSSLSFWAGRFSDGTVWYPHPFFNKADFPDSNFREKWLPVSSSFST